MEIHALLWLTLNQNMSPILNKKNIATPIRILSETLDRKLFLENVDFLIFIARPGDFYLFLDIF